MTSLLRKIGWLVRRRRKEAELEEELQFHLDEEAEQRQAEELSSDQARWAARRNLGNVALVQENTRAAWGWAILEQFGRGLRYAFRTMASNRLFTLLAVMSLALGIGANTAIYSFMDWILMQSLPVHDPSSLVVMNWRAKTPRGPGPTKVWHAMSGRTYGDPKTGMTAGIFPYPVFELFSQMGFPVLRRVRILPGREPQPDSRELLGPRSQPLCYRRLFSRARRITRRRTPAGC
jgi:hypothetical protein